MSSTESFHRKQANMKGEFVAQPVVDLEAGSSEDGRKEELKRDLGARHINMIAIAGMIVSYSDRNVSCNWLMRIGNWTVSQLWEHNSIGWTSWSLVGVYLYGFRDCRHKCMLQNQNNSVDQADCCLKFTTGEITAFMPVTGGFVRHATAFVEPALGAATGWNFCKRSQHLSKKVSLIVKGIQWLSQSPPSYLQQQLSFNSGTLRQVPPCGLPSSL